MFFRFILILSLMLLASNSFATQKIATIYCDGILITEEVNVVKGVAELTLPLPLKEHGLRVKPLGGGSIELVELPPYKVSAKQQKMLEQLKEQKNRLQDRLKTLADKESIFTAAAKSQSSKTPRPTKTNPNPMAAVRQGTDFAMAQLEAVNTDRRQTLQRLETLEKTFIEQQQTVAGTTVRISASAKKLLVTALLEKKGWTPAYDLHLQKDGNIIISLIAIIPVFAEGYTLQVADKSLADYQAATIRTAKASDRVVIRQWQTSVEQLQISQSPLTSCQFTLKNLTDAHFSTGEATIYLENEYLGQVTLPDTEPGGTISLKSP